MTKYYNRLMYALAEFCLNMSVWFRRRYIDEYDPYDEPNVIDFAEYYIDKHWFNCMED